MPAFAGYTPTPSDEIDALFEFTPVSSSDVVYDLGSGDGRLLFAAIDKGAGRAVGVETDPELVRAARETARSKGLEDRITFLEVDLIEVSLADATVILCYLSSTASAALKQKFETELTPGTRIVMEDFPVIGWKPARTSSGGHTHFYGGTEFYLYIVPPETTEVYLESIYPLPD